MADNVGIFCKSYAPDFDYLRQLLETFQRHNPENLPFTLSLPREDIAKFVDQFGTSLENVVVVADESYCGHDLSKYDGWRGQQVCKLMSCHLMTVDHYAVVDSDCYFIRDMAADDFRPHGGVPFIACGSSIRSVLKPQNDILLRYINGELIPGPEHFPQLPDTVLDRLDEFVQYATLNQNDPNAVARSDIPFRAFGSKRWMFYMPGQIFSRRLVQRMENFFLSHHLTFGDAIMISPWEYNWYGEYAATHAFTETQFRMSPILHFQDNVDLAFARENGITQNIISQRFMLIAMAARHIDEIKL